MKYLLTTLFIVLFLSLSIKSQEPVWLSKIKKIVPIHSTEKDVEVLFGKPKERSKHFAEYENIDGYLSIAYSTGECEPTLYSIEKGIVVGVDFSLKKDFEFNKLNIDLSKFLKEKSDDTENISFSSRELGISYGTYKRYIEEVDYEKRPLILTDIFISPAIKYDHLECPKME